LNPVDIILLIVLVLGAYEGFKKGFLLGLIGLVGFVVAVILGFYFMDSMADWLKDNVKEFNLGYPIVAFLIIFLISIVLIQTVGWILKQVMNLILLGSVDSLGGAILGMVKAAFFISLFIWFGKEFDLDLPKKWEKESEMLDFIEPMAPTVIDAVEPFFPKVGGTKNKLKDLVKQVKGKVEEKSSIFP
jgi:membrane protein required for colicin V production